MPGSIHDHAVVSDDADLGSNVTIGPFTIVHPNVRIGPDTVIGSHCEIGLPTDLATDQALHISEESLVRSHSVIYQGSTFGPRLDTGHHVTLREGLRVGANLRVGTLSDLQGDATFGDYVRLHSNVFVAKGAAIGNFVWIFPNVVLTDDPHPPSDGFNAGVTVEDFAVICAMSCVGPGVIVGKGSVVGAASMVTKNVEPGVLVLGVPARAIGPASDVKLRDGSGTPAYPWTRHFTRGYPRDIVNEWRGDRTEP
jgi:acetyltransferase-like isoleucine patch superfamily enzyme